MSHDRGCYCGREKWDYDTCPDKKCAKRARTSSPLDDYSPGPGVKSSGPISSMDPGVFDPMKDPGNILYDKGGKVPTPATVPNKVKGQPCMPTGNLTDIQKGQLADKWERINAEKGINPKDAIGAKKVPMAYIPAAAQHYLRMGLLPAGVATSVLAPVCFPATALFTALGMWNGAFKYDPYNWRTGGKVQASIYVDAFCRHIYYWGGREELARDSLVPHLGHGTAGLSILIDAFEGGYLHDDRPKFNFDHDRFIPEELMNWDPWASKKASFFMDAAVVWVNVWINGYNYIRDTRVPVLGRAFASMSRLIELSVSGELVDDRPVLGYDAAGMIDGWNSQAPDLLSRWEKSKSSPKIS